MVQIGNKELSASTVVQWLVLLIAVIMAAYGTYMSFTAEDPSAIVESAIRIEAERVSKEIEQTKETNESLRTEIEQLNSEIGTLREEIKESVKKREELHDAISKARNIRDIDRILDSGKR